MFLSEQRAQGKRPQRPSPQQRHCLERGCRGHHSPSPLAWRGRSALGYPPGHSHGHRSVRSTAFDPMFTEPAHTRQRCFENALQPFPHPVRSIDNPYVPHSPLGKETFYNYPQQANTQPPSALRDPGVTQNTPEWFLLLLLFRSLTGEQPQLTTEVRSRDSNSYRFSDQVKCSQLQKTLMGNTFFIL